MDPCPAAGGANKERVVICHRQVVDGCTTDARTRCKLCACVPLPGDISDRHQRPGAGDDAGSDPEAARFHSAAAGYEKGMLGGAGQALGVARLSVIQGDGDEGGSLALDVSNNLLYKPF